MRYCDKSLADIILSKGFSEVNALIRVKITNNNIGNQQGKLREDTFTSRLNEDNHKIIPEKIKICEIEIENGAEIR